MQEAAEGRLVAARQQQRHAPCHSAALPRTAARRHLHQPTCRGVHLHNELVRFGQRVNHRNTHHAREALRSEGEGHRGQGASPRLAAAAQTANPPTACWRSAGGSTSSAAPQRLHSPPRRLGWCNSAAPPAHGCWPQAASATPLCRTQPCRLQEKISQAGWVGWEVDVQQGGWRRRRKQRGAGRRALPHAVPPPPLPLALQRHPGRERCRPLRPASSRTVQAVGPIVDCQLVALPIQLKLCIGDAVGHPPHDGTHVGRRAILQREAGRTTGRHEHVATRRRRRSRRRQEKEGAERTL